MRDLETEDFSFLNDSLTTMIGTVVDEWDAFSSLLDDLETDHAELANRIAELESENETLRGEVDYYK